MNETCADATTPTNLRLSDFIALLQPIADLSIGCLAPPFYTYETLDGSMLALYNAFEQLHANCGVAQPVVVDIFNRYGIPYQCDDAEDLVDEDCLGLVALGRYYYPSECIRAQKHFNSMLLAVKVLDKAQEDDYHRRWLTLQVAESLDNIARIGEALADDAYYALMLGDVKHRNVRMDIVQGAYLGATLSDLRVRTNANHLFGVLVKSTVLSNICTHMPPNISSVVDLAARLGFTDFERGVHHTTTFEMRQLAEQFRSILRSPTSIYTALQLDYANR